MIHFMKMTDNLPLAHGTAAHMHQGRERVQLRLGCSRMAEAHHMLSSGLGLAGCGGQEWV